MYSIHWPIRDESIAHALAKLWDLKTRSKIRAIADDLDPPTMGLALAWVAAEPGSYGIGVNCVSPGPVLISIWAFEQMSDDEIETLG